jgi:transcriptional regulator with XRE-family HTH domain
MLSDQLRTIIRQSGRSQYSICQEAGIDRAHLHRFLHGDRQLTTDSMDKIGKVLRLRLAVDDK